MAIRVDSCIDYLSGCLLPPRCVLCGEAGQRPCLDLCDACERSLPRRTPAILEGCLAPFEYAYPVDRLVQALKYQGRLAVGRVLGSLIGAAVLEHGLHLRVDVVLPVPLHPRRHAERTFNQSAEIGRRAARIAGCRYLEGAVMRVRDTRPQVGLDFDERHSNLRGAFECRADLRGRSVAIVDDVVTTGSTVREVARSLHSVGALRVDVWCVARAPRRGTVDSPSMDHASNA